MSHSSLSQSRSLKHWLNWFVQKADLHIVKTIITILSLTIHIVYPYLKQKKDCTASNSDIFKRHKTEKDRETSLMTHFEKNYYNYCNLHNIAIVMTLSTFALNDHRCLCKRIRAKLTDWLLEMCSRCSWSFESMYHSTTITFPHIIKTSIISSFFILIVAHGHSGQWGF